MLQMFKAFMKKPTTLAGVSLQVKWHKASNKMAQLLEKYKSLHSAGFM